MNSVAIVGLACLFPGAQDPHEFWRNLVAARDLTSLATVDEMGVDPALFYHPQKGVQDRYYCMRGGYIRNFTFDPAGYALPAEALQQLDPLFQWSLYVAREALRDSGYLSIDDSRSVPQLHSNATTCGVILGSLLFPTRTTSRLFAPLYTTALEPLLRERLQHPHMRLSPHAHEAEPHNEKLRTQPLREQALFPGYVPSVVARALGLSGVSLSLDAACATSLYAVKLACHYLQSGQADMMLAGAVSCPDPMFMHMGFSIFQAYPQQGTSRPLDRSSQGLFSGEGAGMVVLKRYEDARRDGDTIHATIRGGGLSNDGSGKHLLIPNPKGQLLAFERAYAEAGVDSHTIDYVECHATGTPVGDITELNSMAVFFGKHGTAPRIGSVKSNVGHLLTAAGMASLIKVILSMQHNQVPPTINLDDPLASHDNTITTQHAVSELIPWPAQSATRRAGVSAFGFGGVNAHLVLEQGTGDSAQHREQEMDERQQEAEETPRLAIIGMDAHFGPCSTLQHFAHSIYEGKQEFVPLPPKRWKGIEGATVDAVNETPAPASPVSTSVPPTGAYIDTIDIDFRRFKMPPIEGDQPIPQHLLLLKVADQALHDAGLTPGGNVAVVVAVGPELALHQFRGRVDLEWQLERSLAEVHITLSDEERSQLAALAKDSLHTWPQVNQYTSFIGNVIASRVAALWDFSGPAFTVSSEGNATTRALEMARLFLAAGEVEAVVVGAVDLAAGLESVLLHRTLAPLSASNGDNGGFALPYDQHGSGWLPGEGAGAVVLKRYESAQQACDRIYAIIDAVTIATHQSAADTQLHVCQQALQAAGCDAGEVGYVEMTGGGIVSEEACAAALQHLIHAYGDAPALTCAFGSVEATIGYTFAAAGMASLIKTALCLYQRYIPPVPHWSAPAAPAVWQQSPFYVASESRPWLLDSCSTRRIAAINEQGLDGSYGHLILSEDAAQRQRLNGYLEQMEFFLFPIAAADVAMLQAQLDALEQRVQAGDALATVAYHCFTTWQAASPLPYALALTGHNQAELLREIERARTGIIKAVESGEDWSTPTGSYFAPQPLAQQGQVAFVYPGAFNAYIGLGQHLFHLFPTIYDSFSQVTCDMERSIGATLLYPRSMAHFSSEQLHVLEAGLIDDSIRMLEIGTSFATLYTMVMRDVFGVQPAIAFGYSQGETAMMHALGVWERSDDASEVLCQSELYHTRLSGAKNAAREYWGNDSSTISDDELWGNYILMAGPEQIKPHLANEPRVSIAIINTPAQVMLSGDPAGCRRVIDKVKCRWLRAPFNHIIHSPPVQSEYAEFVKINAFPVREVPGVRFYSAAEYAPFPRPLTRESVAHNIATVCCQQLDFPRLVERVYSDGATIFLELGPTRNCSRWIDATLGKRPHVALSINKKGADDHASIIKVLAALVSHRVALNLAPLYRQSVADDASRQTSRLVRQIALGGTRIAQVLGSAEPAQQFETLIEAFPPSAQQGELVTMQRVAPESEIMIMEHAANKQNARGQQTAAPAIPTLPAEGAVSDDAPHAALHTPFSEALRQSTALATQAHTSFLSIRSASFQQLHDMVQQYMHAAHQTVPGTLTIEHPTTTTSPTGQTIEQSVEHEQPVLRITEPGVQTTQRETEVSDQHHATATTPDTSSTTKPAIWDEAALLEFAEGKIANVFGEEYAIIDSYRRRVRLPTPPYLLVSRITQISGKKGVFQPCTITTEYDIPYNAWYAVDGQIPWAVAVESGQCDLLLISYLGIDFECQGERVYRLLDCTLTFMDDLPKEGQTLRYEISINSFARSGDTLIFFFSYDCFVGERLVLKMTNGCAGFFTDQELAEGKGVIITESEREARSKVQKRFVTPPLQCQKTAFSNTDLRALTQGDIAACFGAHYNQRGRNPALRLPQEQLVMADRIVSVDPHGGLWGLGLLIAEQDLKPDDWYFPCHFKDDEVMAGSLMAEGCFQLMQFYLLYLGMQVYTSDARIQLIPNLPQVVCCRGQALPNDGMLTYQMEITDIGFEPAPYAIGNIAIILGGKTIVTFTDLGVQLVERGEMTSDRRQAPQSRAAVLIDEQRIREFTHGSVVACFGEEYHIYDNRRLPRTPNGDLQLMSRVVSAEAQRHDYTPGSSLISEYDVPADAWFYTQNSDPFVPYSILMEIALQPCGFLSAYLGSCLLFPDADLYFRNLDGHGHLLDMPDLRGKTITNHARLISSSSIQGVIIQKFGYEVACAGTAFYTGEAVFGYFTPEALANQIGLDSGTAVAPWYLTNEHTHLKTTMLNLHAPDVQQRLYRAPAGKPHYRLAHDQLNFLDQVMIIEGGGDYSHDYIYASKRVNPAEWFFTAHFFQDPVMPGSLGIEAIVQAMQAYALQHDLGRPFASPHFAQVENHEVVWKYRGQITREVEHCALEVHISSVQHHRDQVIIIGNASLWRDHLRIYEVKGVALRLVGELVQ